MSTPATDAVPELRLEEGLAIGPRLWLRGRVPLSLLTPKPSDLSSTDSHFNGNGKSPLPLLRIETRVSGQVFESEGPLTPDGQFEALFCDGAPLAKRGWRIARNRLTCAGRSLEKCTMVLA